MCENTNNKLEDIRTDNASSRQCHKFPDVPRNNITIEKIPCPECGVLLRPVEVIGKRHYKFYSRANPSVVPKKRG